MTLASSMGHGRVVGALACQKDSYLHTLDAEVLSCVKFSSENAAQQKKSKKNAGNSTVPDMWLIEFTDSVLFPEGTYVYACNLK